MKILQFKIDTTRGEVTDLAGQIYREISVVNGDVVLIAAQFTGIGLDGASEEDVDFSGALALRATIGRRRQTGTDILAFQDVFNDGDIPAFENLATGRITWLLFLNPATINEFIGANESLEVFLEFTVLNVDDTPQTLAQIGMVIFSQIDDGAVGVPPPAASYITSATALLTFARLIDYLVPETVSGGPTTLTSIKGLKVVLVDTSGGDETINLPESSVSDPEFSPIIFNLGVNKVFVVPDATGTADTINDILGIQTIVSQYGALRLFNDPTNDNWLAPNFVVP